MRKISFVLLPLCFFLEAAQVDFYAKSVQKEGELIKANDEVLIFSDLYFIKADKAIYNETSKEVELFGDISVLRGEEERSTACYAKLNLENNEANFENFFFANNDLEVWFQSQKSELNDKNFIGQNSIVSSCNVENPDWQLKFSEGELNRENNFLHIYNAKLYVKNVPIFYLPYFGFSVDTSRKSGLLIPKIEFNRNDGLFYEQPIYLVFDEHYDIEFDPQIRAQRGIGVYSTLRFMDSAYSSGELNAGYFRERKDYFEKEGLKNQSHDGVELKYLRQDFLKNYFALKDNFQEGLWLDAIYLNDVDYLNLGRRDYRDLTSLATSKMNYFLADENNYYAAYARYYIDTSAISNAATLQEYPSFQYHRFLDGIFDNIFQYSYDGTFNRYYRSEGVYANFMNANLPLTYHQALFDDFLQFNFTETFIASFADYTRRTRGKDREYLIQNYHNLALYTDLAKAYNNFYHTLNLELDYVLRGASTGEITQDFLRPTDFDDGLNLKISQYFYNKEAEKKLKHRLNFNYDTKTQKFTDFQNLMQYFFAENFSVSNEAEYSYSQTRFTKVISQIDMNLQKFNFNFTHAYKNDASENLTSTKHSFIGARVDYSPNINYKLFSGVWFDTQRAHLNAWEVGYTFQRKCWNYSIVYKERIDPQLTSAGINAKSKNGVYFVFNFYPIGGVQYDFSLQENESQVGSL
ncbi:LPS-assembly protein LptD [Campylobacter sp. MIT 12-8780]|uniref:LPS-assembly protein LptD n=1 Tax=Campylobacter sp. MIT 12-8780 TaxID=2202200 RepID=UPI00115EF427|nr:LPS-assembly protein LptD [Campylobacter sp. MIT 12-8780]TQR43060.1 LPS-assembly protein LptD [Campylobacter sp. MIT 12-8780]